MTEIFTNNGWTATLHQDEGCSNPREDCSGYGIFVGFKHRHYTIGDEQINPAMQSFDCPVCRGSAECERCDGRGWVNATSNDELQELVAVKYGGDNGTRMIVPVGMIDHSGVSYYLGGGSSPFDPGGWDSGTCGFLIYTNDMLREWGQPEDWPNHEILKSMSAEIAGYSAWANGECYGYTITDPNGDEVDDSCWGLIGYDYAEGEAKRALADCAEGPQPNRLHELPRVTIAEFRVICESLHKYGHTDTGVALLEKLDAIEL